MKIHSKIWFTCLGFIIIACGSSSQSSIEGKIENLPEHINTVVIHSENNLKNISIDNNGYFKDTINYDNELAYFDLGGFGSFLFLDKSSQLKITADAKNFNNSIQFSGKGALENNYITKRLTFTKTVGSNIDSILNLEKLAFDSCILNLQKKAETLLDQHKGMSSFLEQKEKEALTSFIESLKEQYNFIKKGDNLLEAGYPSPEFNNLKNYNGGTTSLKDLRGNYVYIDVWATWCMPCLQQIPHLQKLEKQFHNKPIKFVSLSIDNPTAENQWRQAIEKQNMGGIQLFAGGNIPFLKDYQISTIPRFILIDKEGNIINADAPRPSDSSFRKYLNELVK